LRSRTINASISNFGKLPDGHTPLFGTIQTHRVNASLFGKMPYHPINDSTLT